MVGQFSRRMQLQVARAVITGIGCINELAHLLVDSSRQSRQSLWQLVASTLHLPTNCISLNVHLKMIENRARRQRHRRPGSMVGHAKRQQRCCQCVLQVQQACIVMLLRQASTICTASCSRDGAATWVSAHGSAAAAAAGAVAHLIVAARSVPVCDSAEASRLAKCSNRYSCKADQPATVCILQRKKGNMCRLADNGGQCTYGTQRQHAGSTNSLLLAHCTVRTMLATCDGLCYW